MAHEFDLQLPATEVEIADALIAANAIQSNGFVSQVIRRLAFERYHLRAGLREIAGHSVCCDARHAADRILAGMPAKLAEEKT